MRNATRADLVADGNVASLGLFAAPEVGRTVSSVTPLLEATPLSPEVGASLRRTRLAWVLVLYAVIACGLGVHFYVNFHFIRTIIASGEDRAWLRFALHASAIWLALVTFLLMLRTALWIAYRSFPPAAVRGAPSLTVVIPAYNEGAMVLTSIESVISARYPADRLEVLVVDDGSKDDTWQHIQKAAERHPRVVTAVRFPANRGKRAALSAGFERARGEFIVTLDSDSVIDPEALLAITGPFRNPKVGAVAGKVAVYNQHEGLIPRMLHIRYLLTFDVLRAVESSYGTVYCCPGALTAYRASAIRTVLDRWMRQTFLGVHCTFGEDRAMTNYLLAEGYDTVYQSSAEVRTIVPVRYSKMSKMFLRWDRSYIREELRLMKIAWRRPPLARIITLFDRIVTNLQFPVGYVGLALLVVAVIAHPEMLLRFVLTTLLVSLLSTAYVLRSEPSLRSMVYGVMMSFFSTFAMSWILPYAFFTVRARSWLTR